MNKIRNVVLILSFCLASLAFSEVKADALDFILWYQCEDDSADGVVEDSSGYGHDGTAPAGHAPAFIADGGYDGAGAYSFDGTEDWIVVPDSAILYVTSHTRAAWVKLTYDGTWNAVFDVDSGLYTSFLSDLVNGIHTVLIVELNGYRQITTFIS